MGNKENQKPTSSSSSTSKTLQKRALLPRGIKPKIRPSLSTSTPFKQRHVLLTGSTGFLGSHLLSELLKSSSTTNVTCLVRAPDTRTAWNRIKASLKNWGLWNGSFGPRIEVLCGDVGKGLLGLRTEEEYKGLARKVDSVYHAAAVCDLGKSFAELEGTNVAGTVEVLRFASTETQKRVLYISSLAVFFGAGDNLASGMEIPIQPTGENEVVTGYAQTKWMSEQLVLEYARLGGHALIVRPGNLFGSMVGCKCPKDGLVIRLMTSMLEMGVAPRLDEMGGKNWRIDLTPVHYCAYLTHRLALKGEKGIRHVIRRDTVSFETIVDGLGKRVQFIPYKEWLQLVKTSENLAPFSRFFLKAVSEWDQRSVFEMLLQMKVFRSCNFEASAPASASDDGLPSAKQLLQLYLSKNDFLRKSQEKRSAR